jgi:putative two-component system response regulator
MKVLLADDDNAMRLYFTRFLEKKGFTVTACSNGKDAWDEFQKEPFNLILLDWNMPEMTGAELCERIKQTQIDSYAYVILITSRSDSEDIIEGLESGADDYITKPVVAAELNARISSALRVLDFEEKLKNKEKEVRLNCYRTLTQLAETRDHESEGHMNRVGEFCEMIGRQMGLDEKFCQDLKIFGPMHDIGKVGIPDGILHVPRELCREEFQVIKLHTQIGWQILKDKEVFKLAAEIAYTHHEHWDGQGYPRHLKGEEIPLAGRICAVADCYDSLRSVRSYRSKASHAQIIDWINLNSGTLFDPQVVEAALAIQDEMKKLFNETYSDNLETVANRS